MYKHLVIVLTVLFTLFGASNLSNAAKSDNWLIYWYVCGTDIETTRIAFSNNTDLMTGKIGLAEPDRCPGDATRCIKEVERATLSPNVKIFLQAGGTYVWGHEKFRDLNAKIQNKAITLGTDNDGNPITTTVVSRREITVPQWYLTKNQETGGAVAKPVEGGNGKIGRYVYDKNHRNWHAFEKLPISGNKNTATDMGSIQGFISFLQAGQKLERELYPDGNVRRVLIFVDHGGGIWGVCSDEYTGNMLRLQEIHDAFKSVQSGWSNPEEKPFEVVAFDACIMSVYDTAVALEDSAKYMVASQESTLGKVMFGYTDLLNKLSKNPSMSAKELGKVICNATWGDSKVTDREFGISSNVIFTETVIDLSETKMDALKTAYANFGAAALRFAQRNPEDVAETYIRFKNAADTSERFSILGGDAPNMVDLKNFAANLRNTVPELQESSTELIKALDNSVVYNKRGGAFKRGGGLSIYYPHNLIGGKGGIDAYKVLTARLSPDSTGKLYDYLFEGVTENLVQTGNGWGIPANSIFNLRGLSDIVVDVDPDKNTATIELDEDQQKGFERVNYLLLYFKPRNDGSDKMDTLLLGTDSEVEENRKAGTFKINLNNKKWMSLDGNPLYVQVVADSTRKGKNGKKISGNDICLSPILLNDKPYKLFLSRSYPGQKVTVIGVVPNEGDQTTLPSGLLESLKKGDVVTPLYIYGKDEDVEEFSAEEFSQKTQKEQMEIAGGFMARGNPIVIGDNPKFEMSTLGNGIFGYAFQFVNPIAAKFSVVTVDGAVCKIKNGKILKTINADYFDVPADLD